MRASSRQGGNPVPACADAPGSNIIRHFRRGVTMTALRHLRAVSLVCALTCAGSPGCTSLVTIAPVTDPAAPPFGKLEPGDELELTLRDGRKIDVEIERIEGDSLLSEEGERYHRSEIVVLRHHQFSEWKTLLLAGG